MNCYFFVDNIVRAAFLCEHVRLSRVSYNRLTYLLTQVDQYGTQQPIALLKLLLERGGCYNRGKDLNWKGFRDLGWIAAMGKPGGGRNDVDPRFISLFSVFNMTFPAEESLYHIYNSILHGHVQPFVKEIQDMVPEITRMTMELYRQVVYTF